MVKYIAKVGLLVFLVVPMLLIPSAAHAGDGGTIDVDVTGDYLDVGVGVYGSNNSIWIDGVGDLGSLGARALQGSIPNSSYNEVGTGYLPPLNRYGVVAAVAPEGKYDQPLIGWRGYFSPETNVDESVYKGSGCGGTWGVCDGYPDMWTRRQIAGLAPMFVAQYEKMETVIAALAKVIQVTNNNQTQLNGNGGVAELKLQLSQLADVSHDLSVLAQRQAALEATVQQQRADYTRQLTILAAALAFVFVCLTAAVVYFGVYIRRLRSQVG